MTPMKMSRPWPCSHTLVVDELMWRGEVIDMPSAGTEGWAAAAWQAFDDNPDIELVRRCLTCGRRYSRADYLAAMREDIQARRARRFPFVTLGADDTGDRP